MPNITSKIRIYFFIFISISSVFCQNLTNLELIFVYQHIRHGHRGPSSFPNSQLNGKIDEFGISWEEEGDGELTSIGKREHYDIGVKTRKKYGKDGLGLIDFSQYNPKEVLFHATDSNRTHQSLNSELIAMYQPGSLKTLTENELKQSCPPNEIEWSKRKGEKIYSDILDEISSLGNMTIINNIPVFNLHNFPSNRIFVLENFCSNLTNVRLENVKKNWDLLFGYFLEHKEVLKKYFKFENDSYLSDVSTMLNIVDHYISDYKANKNLSSFHESTGIDLEEFWNVSTKYYYNWMYTYYCTNETCVIESSPLMRDLLGYMEKRIDSYPNINYKAPKLVIDCGHDTTVAPIQMFMYTIFRNSTKYGVKTKYCGFTCNVIFELYKSQTDNNKYFVYYYIDDELISIFDYDDFSNEIKKNLYSLEDIEKYCSVENIDNNEKNNNTNDNYDNDESVRHFFNRHKYLWVIFAILIFLIALGIATIIILIVKLNKFKKKLIQNNDISNNTTQENIKK